MSVLFASGLYAYNFISTNINFKRTKQSDKHVIEYANVILRAYLNFALQKYINFLYSMM